MRNQHFQTLVSRVRSSSPNSRAGHPGWRRCSSIKYSRWIRTALGARTADVLALVLRSGMTITAAGLAAGLAAAALLAQSLSKILYGVGPFDPATFILMPLVLAVAAGLACLVPARRAARIDPLRAPGLHRCATSW
jgi:CHASE2 domain-containing sensor protein